jgi:hypothetical protein
MKLRLVLTYQVADHDHIIVCFLNSAMNRVGTPMEILLCLFLECIFCPTDTFDTPVDCISIVVIMEKGAC